MKNLSLIASVLAMLGLTACEKELVDGVADVAPTGQVMNSVLQVRTRSGGSAGEEATVAYPIAVYVLSGEECRAVQTIGDEGQTLNIGLTEVIRCLVASHGASVPLPLFWNSLIVHIASVKPARRQIAPTINLQGQPSPHCQPERYNRIAGIKTHTVTGNAKIALTTLKFKSFIFLFSF